MTVERPSRGRLDDEGMRGVGGKRGDHAVADGNSDETVAVGCCERVEEPPVITPQVDREDNRIRRGKREGLQDINMVAIGEESGNLDEMLHEAAEHYDSELEFAMKRISDSIGPLLTVCLAAMVLFFALAIYLPMWDMVKMVK